MTFKNEVDKVGNLMDNIPARHILVIKSVRTPIFQYLPANYQRKTLNYSSMDIILRFGQPPHHKSWSNVIVVVLNMASIAKVGPNHFNNLAPTKKVVDIFFLIDETTKTSGWNYHTKLSEGIISSNFFFVKTFFTKKEILNGYLYAKFSY